MQVSIDPYVTFLNVECGMNIRLKSALSPGYEISTLQLQKTLHEIDLAEIHNIVECPYAGGNSTATMVKLGPEISAFKITYENARKPGMLRLQKVSAADQQTCGRRSV